MVLTLLHLLIVVALFCGAVLADAECVMVSPKDLKSRKWHQQTPNLGLVALPSDSLIYSYKADYNFAHPADYITRYLHHTKLTFSVSVLKKPPQGDTNKARSIFLDSTVAAKNWDWPGRPFRIQFVMHTGFDKDNNGVSTFDYWIKSQDSCSLRVAGNDGKKKIPFYAEDIKEVVLWRHL